jgi:hypothetical protein
MTEDALHLNFTADGSNVEPWLGEGWHGAELGHRWTDGLSSVLRLPPFKPQEWFVLTIDCWPYHPPGVVQTLRLVLNGTEIAHYRPQHLAPHAVAAPGALVRDNAENVLELHHPDAASPALTQEGASDARLLSLAVKALDFEPLDEPLHLAPRLLPDAVPPDDAAGKRAVMEMFQSLGQNCGLGGTQRRFGAEPFGLLRFASVHPEQLFTGLKTRFAGVGDVAQLSFHVAEDTGELKGRHALYGLDYHTFRKPDEIDVAAFAQKEAQRLGYLARLFFEQIENDEKIFVRVGAFESPGEALALHRLLCGRGRRARLLILDRTPDHAPERAGRVIEWRRGLYRGYFLSHEHPVLGPRPPPEEWLRLCATVLAYEGARA